MPIKKKTKRLKARKKPKMNTVSATELTVNGVAYVPKGAEQSYTAKGDIKIVVLQRGWVMVGKFEKVGSDCKLHKASVIRNWGTTKGLGEIAQAGPTSSTKIDSTNGLVEFDYLTVIAAISCNELAWAKYV